MLTHHNVGANVSAFLQPGGTNHQYATGSFQEVYVCLLPFFHTYGVTVVMMAGFETGAKLVTLPKLDVPSFFKALDDHKVRNKVRLQTKDWVLDTRLLTCSRRLFTLFRL